MCVYSPVCRYLSVDVSICKHLYLYNAKDEFLLTDPALTSTTWMDLIPHLSIISYSNSEKPGSWHLSSTYLIVHFQHMCMVVSVLTLPVWDSTLSTRVQFLCTVPFAFNRTDPLISSFLSQHLSSTLFSEAFHTFLTYTCHRVLVWMLPSLPSYFLSPVSLIFFTTLFVKVILK